MRFNGRLQTDADPHGWLKSELSILGGKVELSAGEDLLGSWSLGQVKAERLEGDRFELLLGEDRAVFAADDALAFSYEALPKLTRKPLAEAAHGFRKFLGGGRKATSPVEQPAVVEPAPEPEPEPEVEEVPANVRRLRELIEVAKANRPEEAHEEETTEPDSSFDDEEFVLTEPAEDEVHEPGPLWSMPAHPFSRPPHPAEESRPVTLSIVDAPPVDLATVFVDRSDLSDEIDQLSELVKRTRLNTAQTEAARDLIRALRALLKT
jgi:hypothetical protein